MITKKIIQHHDIITGSLSPPEQLHISGIDFSSRKLTFAWSSVSPDCPADHYNILASNCGSCPTTTNHTTVTCIDVPTNGSVCTFALQTVVCGNITGIESDPVSSNFYATEQTRAPIGIIHPTDNEVMHHSDTTEMLGNHNSDTNMVHMIFISTLATALIVSTVVFITVMVIISTTSKAKIKAVREHSNRPEGTIHAHDEPMYEDVTGPLPSVDVIDTQANVAYGHGQTVITTT